MSVHNDFVTLIVVFIFVFDAIFDANAAFSTVVQSPYGVNRHYTGRSLTDMNDWYQPWSTAHSTITCSNIQPWSTVGSTRTCSDIQLWSNFHIMATDVNSWPMCQAAYRLAVSTSTLLLATNTWTMGGSQNLTAHSSRTTWCQHRPSITPAWIKCWCWRSTHDVADQCLTNCVIFANLSRIHQTDMHTHEFSATQHLRYVVLKSECYYSLHK